MKLFLDSANLTEIREAMTWGAIDGVTTNPSLVAREQRNFFPLLKEICETVKGPVSMETTRKDADTQILVASVRHPRHVVEAARLGADIATLPFGVLEALVRHPLTEIGLERFLKDWEKLPPAAKAPQTTPTRSTAARAPARR